SILVCVQILILRRKFEWKNILQIFVGVIFGYFTTFFNWGASFLPTPENMVIRLVMMVISTCCIAVGIFFYVPPNIMPLAIEGTMETISKVTKIEFPKVKIGFDCTMVVISLVSCLVGIHSLGSVGIGTAFGAVFVGVILGKLNRSPLGAWRNKILHGEQAETAEIPVAAENGFVVTISREYGSGGREIGRQLAEKLGIAYYDLNLIQKVAAESGYSEAYVQEAEQKVASPVLLNLYSWYTAATSEQDLPKVEQLYHAEERVIRELASKGSCVIVGRLANYILKDFENGFHVFIGADMDVKLKRVMKRDCISREQAEKQINKVEKERANHCAYFTHEQWGNAKHYDVMLKSNLLGVSGTVELLEKMLGRVYNI
ncbi:MAG: cytidylate kinase family protein, partial [Anaerotignum sp.]|nr:cytidylate kinase family protein [Anaerotignum sp.]